MNDTGNRFVTQSSWNVTRAKSDIARYMEMAAPIAPETWFTVHHRVFLPGNPEPIFPGNAHREVATAVEDAKYWANKGTAFTCHRGCFVTLPPQKRTLVGK